MKLANDFNTFLLNISLGATPVDRIDSATKGLTKHLREQYGLSAADVFVQGSYANDTAVEPADPDAGEYDVDLVCVCAGADATADSALDDLEAKLAASDTYKQMLKRDGTRRTPCVRLRYADDSIGGFHVDVVPARASTSADPQAPLEVPRRKDGWHDTAPQEFTDWCRDQGPRFARTVKMLKRWRAENQSARTTVKSIVLQVLAANNLDHSGSDAEALVRTLGAIQQALAGHPTEPPEVLNPVLEAENLAARWTTSSYQDFRKALDDAVDLSTRALKETDRVKSHELWQELLGEDFPDAPKPPRPPGPGPKPDPDEGRTYG